MRQIAILGSTGSIGTQALNIIDKHREEFEIVALAGGGGRIDLLAHQAVAYNVDLVAVYDSTKLDALRETIFALENARGCARKDRVITCGPQGVIAAARAVPEGTVLNGITGGVGLKPTLAALETGAKLALANKESLVVAGSLVRAAVRYPGQIIPVDSEHSAIAQALLSGVHERGLTQPVLSGRSEVSKLILTASGGPFRGRQRADLSAVTAKEALAHPTWDMGPVVTINSSTLMNKGLELIEAHLLFDIDPKDIIPVVHPQSVVHSMVQWQDGSTIAQASPPDMGLPIALGMTWPRRLDNVAASCVWDSPVRWDFEPVDMETFPAINICRQAVGESGTHPAVLNAANEVCVDAFLRGKLGYLDIVDTVAQVLEEHQGVKDPDLQQILAAQKMGVAAASAILAA